MKFGSFILIVVLGVLFFSVIGDRMHLNLPAPLQKVSAAFNGLVSTASPKGQGKALVVPANEPRQTVYVRNIVRVRGHVLKVVDGAAVVDCDFQAPIPAEVAERFRQIARDRGAGTASLDTLAQDQANEIMFGSLVVLDESDAPRPTELKPTTSAGGKILLRGMAVAPGAKVHVVTALLGKTPNGEGVYTAKIAIQGGAWMWNGQQGTLLDKRGKFQERPKFEQPKPLKGGL